MRHKPLLRGALLAGLALGRVYELTAIQSASAAPVAVAAPLAPEVPVASG